MPRATPLLMKARWGLHDSGRRHPHCSTAAPTRQAPNNPPLAAAMAAKTLGDRELWSEGFPSQAALLPSIGTGAGRATGPEPRRRVPEWRIPWPGRQDGQPERFPRHQPRSGGSPGNPNRQALPVGSGRFVGSRNRPALPVWCEGFSGYGAGDMALESTPQLPNPFIRPAIAARRSPPLTVHAPTDCPRRPSWRARSFLAPPHRLEEP